MGFKCIIPSCPHHLISKNVKQVYSVPRDASAREKWLKLIGLTEECLTQIIWPRVCYLHFNEDDFFVFSTKRKLKRGAVPSLFLTCPSDHSQTQTNRTTQSTDQTNSSTKTPIKIREKTTAKRPRPDTTINHETAGNPRQKPIYQCPDCNKVLKDISSLEYHNKIHNDIRPYLCQYCGKTFRAKNSYINHLRIHTGEKPFRCPHCPMKFTLTTTLNAHVNVHLGVKPYVCKECGKGFRQTQGLKTHLRTHNGEKPFVCVICNKGCTTRGNLKVHLRAHTGEKSRI